MFDYRFIKLILDFVKYYNFHTNRNSNWGLIQKEINKNYTKINKKEMNIVGTDDIDIYKTEYHDFIEYYDTWYFSF